MRTLAGQRKQLARELASRRAFQAQGLRCDGKPRALPKSCGCRWGSCLKCNPKNKLFVPWPIIMAMHCDYMAGLSLGQIGRKYPVKEGKPRATSEIKSLFLRRGLELLPVPQQCRHQIGNPGCFLSKPRKTKKEISALIRQLKRLSVPEALKYEWREWPMSKRVAFIQRCRRNFPSLLPTGPYSKNVIPFKYGSPAAIAIEQRINAGRNSQTKLIKIKPISEGVIYQGDLWFWNKKVGYQKGTKWTPENGRPMLHHVIYEKHYGPVPAGMTVIFKDDNKNNLVPSNLTLRSMAQCAKQNAWHKNPAINRKQMCQRIQIARAATMAAKSRRQVGSLLKSGALINRIKQKSSI